MPEPADQTDAPYQIGSEKLPGLGKMVEEAGELLQIIGKIMGLGHTGDHWDGTNLQRELEKEIADLRASTRFFILANELNATTINSRDLEKLNLFTRWHRNILAGREPYTDEDGVRRVPEHLWEKSE
jgi:ABC-type phosphate transport system auxiliary subunit